MNLPRHLFFCFTLLVCPVLCVGQTAQAPVAQAESTQSASLKLETAVETALRNYPAIREARARIGVTQAGEEQARTALLPRADLLWQSNLATRNNVFGLLLPQSTLPNIAGPQLDTTTAGGAFGSAGGLLLSWEPFDFGLRKSNIDLARAATSQARAGEEVTKFDVSFAAADAFLISLANEQAVTAATAGVERAETLLTAVRALVENQLRPGVDQSRAEAELATAKNQLIQARQNLELSRITLAEAMGEAGTTLAGPDAGPLLELPPAGATPATTTQNNFSMHPLAMAQTAALDFVRARAKTLERTYYPRFNFQSAVFARGSSALLNGKFDYGKGFYPDTGNWATGVTITFPITDIFGLRARRKAETAQLGVEQARYDQVVQTLKTQDARARALIDGARKIAENTPLQLKAARETLQRARARYEFGLTSIVEVADAQRLLTQAEIEHSLAKLAIWRALLAAAKLQGDIKPFLDLARK
ncbi:MAG: TolC family protein [Blastocatellia bacterium]